MTVQHIYTRFFLLQCFFYLTFFDFSWQCGHWLPTFFYVAYNQYIASELYHNFRTTLTHNTKPVTQPEDTRTCRVNLGGESERAGLALFATFANVPFNKAMNPHLLQWSCTEADRANWFYWAVSRCECVQLCQQGVPEKYCFHGNHPGQ